MEYTRSAEVPKCYWGEYELRLSIGRVKSLHISSSPDDNIYVRFSMDRNDIEALFKAELYENARELDLRLKKHRNASKANLSPRLSLDVAIPFDAMARVDVFAVGDVCTDPGLHVDMVDD